MALVFTVDHFPSLHGKVGFHHYEGATSPLTAHYEYCLLGDTVLVIANRHRHPRFRKLASLNFPWGKLELQEGPSTTTTLAPVVGDDSLVIGWL